VGLVQYTDRIPFCHYSDHSVSGGNLRNAVVECWAHRDSIETATGHPLQEKKVGCRKEKGRPSEEKKGVCRRKRRSVAEEKEGRLLVENQRAEPGEKLSINDISN
jgi:hypothetical protein